MPALILSPTKVCIMQAGKIQPSVPDEAAHQDCYVVPASKLAGNVRVGDNVHHGAYDVHAAKNAGRTGPDETSEGWSDVHAAKNSENIVPGKASGCQKCTFLQQNMLQWQGVHTLSLASHVNAGKAHTCCYCS